MTKNDSVLHHMPHYYLITLFHGIILFKKYIAILAHLVSQRWIGCKFV